MYGNILILVLKIKETRRPTDALALVGSCAPHPLLGLLCWESLLLGILLFPGLNDKASEECFLTS